MVAVEVQEGLVELAKKNAELLGAGGRFEIIAGNWKKVEKYFPAKSFHVVMSNPPYRKLKTGKIAPSGSKAIAKHETKGTMRELIGAARYLLKPTGRFYLMYPPLRLEELVQELASGGFKMQKLACIHPYPDRPATQVMVEAVLAKNRELKIEAPVIVYQDPDHYLPEIEAWVGKKRRN